MGPTAYNVLPSQFIDIYFWCALFIILSFNFLKMYLFLEFVRQQSASEHCVKQLFMCILDALQLPFLNIYILKQQ